jgi:hypothetical protein
LEDWWKEYADGTEGRPALRALEAEHGAEWRKDLPGMKTKTTTWCTRKNVYALVEHYMTYDFRVLFFRLQQTTTRFAHSQKKKH